MSQETALIIIAILLFGLIPIVPKLFGVRIRVLRWLKWNKLADWHVRNIPVLTPILRSVMFVLAIILIGVVII